MDRPDRSFSSGLVPEAARRQAEITLGPRLERLIYAAGSCVADVERFIGLAPDGLTRFLRPTHGTQPRYFRAAWLELLPPAVERLYLDERAAAHGCELRPVGDATAPHALVDLVRETTDVMRAAAEAEADGVHTADEIDRELREIGELERVTAARREHLRQLREALRPKVVRGRR